MHQTIVDLMYGFGVALQPAHLIWAIVGVLLGNLIGVLPGMGPITAISMLLPLTYFMASVPAIIMLAGIFYGSQYGGAIGAILLNLPSHPPHAVTCIDGYPLTRMGKGGAALGVAMLSSFFAATVGILVMIFLSPLLVSVAFKFGPAEIASIMVLGLIAGSTMSRGTPLKGIAMTLFGLFCGTIGTDLITGSFRFTFGMASLYDGVELGAICMGVFAIADFLMHVNREKIVTIKAKVRMRDMRPSLADLRKSFWPMVRGTLVGVAFGGMPGTGSTITTFIAYALERKIAKDPEKFGKGAIEGVASPEAASHSKTQVDFIPTMTLGIPGDAVMALILGALILKGIQPGPLLITEHRDIFWGLIASFWIGNVMLMILNVPLIGVWVKMLQVPYRVLFPAAVFFVCIGVFSMRNNLFDVGSVAVFGVAGALFMALDFPVAPILLGFVLGPMLESNFRRALLLSHGDLGVFLRHPICAVVLSIAGIILSWQVGSYILWGSNSMFMRLRARGQYRRAE
ncbi:MAG: tripartite tricarboxylate transporter permease [Burkholderiales bacterium]|nr:tripartite tricarboxylate transporter permease [Burkholderiales bacterium]MDE2611559.1 tripartite tricarboxylate transporter permease [Burkholderiales bacterium]